MHSDVAARENACLLLFAPSAYPLGGVAIWAGYLLPGLRACGWAPTLALTQGRHHDPDAYLRVHGYAPTVAVPCGVGTHAARVRHAAAAIAKATPDIVAFVNLPDVAFAAARQRRRGVFAGKLVAIEHGVGRESFLDLRELSGLLDAFVATNQLACNLAGRFAGFASERVFHAPYGVAQAEPRPHSSSNKLQLLYAGRLEDDQKRVRDLPALADALARRGVAFRLTVAGGGPEEEALKRHFAATAHDVEFLGVVPPVALCERVMAEADALVVLSSWETGPLVAYEAMAAGLPVVTSRFIGAQAEGAFADGANCLMFPVGDMERAADAILKLRDPALRRRLIDAGRALIGGRYSREASVATWDAALTAILALPPLPERRERETLKCQGRLERWFGARAGECIASLAGREYRHSNPGGEWPHLLQRSEAEAERFDRLVSALEECSV